ncbi:hypothetical protein AB0B70_36170 [Microbispora bryophytorum]
MALTTRISGQDADAGAERASRALAALAASGIVVDDFSLGQPSLDEVFLALTGAPPGEHGPARTDLPATGRNAQEEAA